MQWKEDFKNGKRTGKKHPTKHNADILRYDHEENQKMNKKEDMLLERKANIDHEINEVEEKLTLIASFLKDMNV